MQRPLNARFAWPDTSLNSSGNLLQGSAGERAPAAVGSNNPRPVPDRGRQYGEEFLAAIRAGMIKECIRIDGLNQSFDLVHRHGQRQVGRTHLICCRRHRLARPSDDPRCRI